MDVFEWIEKWYVSMCDGEWEHFYGIKIDTLDNPGWIVQIDVLDTELENKPFQSMSNYIDDNSWLHCQVKEGKFVASGDSTKLKVILEVFRNWVEDQK